METKKYIEQRKKLVTQLRSLITLRLQVKRDIRKVRSEIEDVKRHPQESQGR